MECTGAYDRVHVASSVHPRQGVTHEKAVPASPLHSRRVMLATITVSFSPESVAQTDAATSAALDAALAGAHRSDRNKARDRYRHPKETLTFFGLRRDMTVVEIWPGGGWYTEVLAPVLKGKGKLYAAQYGADAVLRLSAARKTRR